MATLKAKDVERALCKKGFVEYNKDHKKFFLYVNGERTSISTKTSHNNQDINNHLQSFMSTQMHLTKNEFLLFVACTISEEKYVEILKSKGVNLRG